jgi:hypothetical protein
MVPKMPQETNRHGSGSFYAVESVEQKFREKQVEKKTTDFFRI